MNEMSENAKTEANVYLICFILSYVVNIQLLPFFVQTCNNWPHANLDVDKKGEIFLFMFSPVTIWAEMIMVCMCMVGNFFTYLVGV